MGSTLSIDWKNYTLHSRRKDNIFAFCNILQLNWQPLPISAKRATPSKLCMFLLLMHLYTEESKLTVKVCFPEMFRSALEWVLIDHIWGFIEHLMLVNMSLKGNWVWREGEREVMRERKGEREREFKSDSYYELLNLTQSTQIIIIQNRVW